MHLPIRLMPARAIKSPSGRSRAGAIHLELIMPTRAIATIRSVGAERGARAITLYSGRFARQTETRRFQSPRPRLASNVIPARETSCARSFLESRVCVCIYKCTQESPACWRTPRDSHLRSCSAARSLAYPGLIYRWDVIVSGGFCFAARARGSLVGIAGRCPLEAAGV